MKNIKNVKVSQLINPHNGRAVVNQLIISINTADGLYQYFKSYDSIIARIEPSGKIGLSEHWDYSKTTSKYRNYFLGMNEEKLTNLVESGEVLIDMTPNGELIEDETKIKLTCDSCGNTENFTCVQYTYWDSDTGQWVADGVHDNNSIICCNCGSTDVSENVGDATKTEEVSA